CARWLLRTAWFAYW
nr:immunoglobulin heavy chain junction region [Mus musculus]